MKTIKHTLIGIATILFLSSLVNAQQKNTGSSIYTFELGNYTIDNVDLSNFINNQSFLHIEMDDERYGYTADPGYPALPQLTQYFHVPNNASNIEVTIQNTDFQTIFIPYGYIEPYIEYGSDSIEGSVYQSLYYLSANTPLVNKYFSVDEPSFIMEKQVIGLTVLPFWYVPKEKKITILKKADFVISWQINGKTETKSVLSSTKELFLQDIVANYIPSKSTRKERLLIIAAPQYESTLSVFSEYKKNIGLDVEMTTTNETGRTVSSIKNYIKNSPFDPDFVLLVGTIDEIPNTSGNIDKIDLDNPVTDQGYRQIQDNDKIYGDVFLGRWIVKDINELANIINKTIYMETHICDIPKEAVFLAGHEDNLYMRNSFKEGHNKAIKNGFSQAGFKSTKYYQSSSSTIETLQKTYPLWFIYAGHGSLYSMAYGEGASIGTTFFSRKELYPFVFSFSCLTGNYSYNSYFPFSITSKTGPILIFGSTVSTYCNSDIAIESKILGKSFSQKYIGSMITEGMTKYRKRFWSALNPKRTKRYMKSYNIIGDPSFLKDGLPSPVEDYVFNTALTALGGVNLTFSCTRDMFINKGISTDNYSSLQFDAIRNISITGEWHTPQQVQLSADNIVIGNGTKVKQGSSLNITANTSIIIEEGVDIEEGAEITICVQ